MKKIIAFLFLVVALSSCYEDYIKDYTYDGIYFSYQVDVRTLVVGEGMKFQYGVALGGVSSNTRDRIVNYTFDNTLINNKNLNAMKGGPDYIKNSVASVSSLLPLPNDYFTVSDKNQFVIKKGQHVGFVSLKADSARVLADPLTLAGNYAIAMQITSADADSVLKAKSYEVIAVKYENMLFGNYWHGGVTVEKDASGNTVKTTPYYTAVNSPTSKAWALKTVGPMDLTSNGYSDITDPTKQFIKLSLNGGTITVSGFPGASVSVVQDGDCKFNQAKRLQDRKIFLKYKYVNAAGNTCYANDTLTFRNRIRDGVNEWQDENPSHYN